MANRPTTGTYDDIDVAQGFLPRQHMSFHLGGTLASLTGTQATNAATLKDLFMVPANSNVKITGAAGKRGVGGTIAATGPHWGLAHSLAGTGANTVFGTLVSGTYADNTYFNMSVTSTDVPAGNVVRVVALAGTTSEETQEILHLTVEYKEDWD